MMGLGTMTPDIVYRLRASYQLAHGHLFNAIILATMTPVFSLHHYNISLTSDETIPEVQAENRLLCWLSLLIHPPKWEFQYLSSGSQYLRNNPGTF
jgi:hypothetical protein